MRNKSTFTTAQTRQRIQKAITRLPNEIGKTAVKFFTDRFRAEAWTDRSAERWKPRKHDYGQKKRKILTKSGRLKRSIRILQKSNNNVIVGSKLPYAAAHNKGMTLHPRVSQKMKQFAWRKYYQNVGKNGEVKKQGSATGASMWKAIALKKVGEKLTVKLPKRKFIGNSALLNRKIERTMIDEIQNAINQNRK